MLPRGIAPFDLDIRCFDYGLISHAWKFWSQVNSHEIELTLNIKIIAPFFPMIIDLWSMQCVCIYIYIYPFYWILYLCNNLKKHIYRYKWSKFKIKDWKWDASMTLSCTNHSGINHTYYPCRINVNSGVFLLVNSPSLAIIKANDGDYFRRWGAVLGSLVRFDLNSISLL